MSYDIVLLSAQGASMKEKVFEFLAGRANCEASSTDIMYENPETGVYFQWIFTPFHEEASNDTDQLVHEDEIGHLRLNFFRPTVFAKEAAIELLALSKALPVEFFDLQQHQIYEEFTEAEQLTKSYFENAQGAVSALRASDEEPPEFQTQPTRALEAVWDWNFGRQTLAESLDEDLFVPRIEFYSFDGEMKTGVVWGDAVPMLCPYVDIVISYRDETAPATGWFRKKRPKTDVLYFEEFAAQYQSYFSADNRVDRAVSCSSSVADELFTEVAKKPLLRETSLDGEVGLPSLEIVPFETILNAEICAPTASEGFWVKSDILKDSDIVK